MQKDTYLPYIWGRGVVCRKFCEKKKTCTFLFCGSYFVRFKTIYNDFFMAHNYEHNLSVFYFWRIKNGREKCENYITAEKKPGYTVYVD